MTKLCGQERVTLPTSSAGHDAIYSGKWQALHSLLTDSQRHIINCVNSKIINTVVLARQLWQA